MKDESNRLELGVEHRREEDRAHQAAYLRELLRASDTFTPLQWANFINVWAAYQGWNDPNRSESEWAALAHTEISEAYEAWRDDLPMAFVSDEGKPEGMAIEYADLLIRVFHWFAAHDINVNEMLARKMDYNISRAYRHGGKRA